MTDATIHHHVSYIVKQELKSQQKRRLILDSLRALLQENVYSQISLEDVAGRAGISKGGLRHHFPTREELYIALITDFFEEIEKNHLSTVEGLGLDSQDRALISTLYGIEQFLLDTSNTRVLINILLFGFEDEKIQILITQFIEKHMTAYRDIISFYRQDEKGKAYSEEALNFDARITQIILLFAGVLQHFAPIKFEASQLVQFLMDHFQNPA